MSDTNGLTDFERIEEITQKWEQAGLLDGSPDPANLALCLRTQTRLMDEEKGDPVFRRTALAVVVKLLREKPTMLCGALDADGLSDVYFLCEWNQPAEGSDEQVRWGNQIVRLIQERVPTGIVFGGLYEKDGKVFLLGEV